MILFYYYPEEFYQPGMDVEQCMRKILNDGKVKYLINEIESKTAKAVNIPTITILETLRIQPSTTEIIYEVPSGTKKFLVERRTRLESEDRTPKVTISFSSMFLNDMVNNVNLVFMFKNQADDIVNMFSDDTLGPNSVERTDSILLLDPDINKSKLPKLINIIKRKFPSTKHGNMAEVFTVADAIHLLSDTGNKNALAFNSVFNPFTSTLSLYSKGKLEKGYVPPRSIELNRLVYVLYDSHRIISLANDDGTSIMAMSSLAYGLFAALVENDELTIEDIGRFCSTLDNIGATVLGMVRGMMYIRSQNNSVNSLNVNSNEDDTDFISSADRRLVEQIGASTADIMRTVVSKDIMEDDNLAVNNLSNVNGSTFKLHREITQNISSIFSGGNYIKDDSQTSEDYLLLLCTTVFRPVIDEYLTKAFKNHQDCLVINMKDDDAVEVNEYGDSSSLHYGLSYLGNFTNCINKYSGTNADGEFETSFSKEKEFDKLKDADTNITSAFTNDIATIRRVDNMGTVDTDQDIIFTNINKFLVEDSIGNTRTMVLFIKFQLIFKGGKYYNNVACYQYFDDTLNQQQANGNK